RPRRDSARVPESGVADWPVSLVADAFVQLTPGTVFNIRAVLPVTKTPGFQEALGDPDVVRILLHQALRLPLGSWSTWAAGLTQVSIGRFDREEVGIADETALTWLEGVLFVKGTLALLGPSYGAR